METSAIDALRTVPLFSELEQDDLESLAEQFREHTFPAGSAVTVEGQRGARILAFFIVTAGTVVVTKDGRELATLGPGDHFGEIALLRDMPRTATVIADSELRCLALGSWDFRPLVERRPEIAWRLLEAMSERLERTEAAG